MHFFPKRKTITEITYFRRKKIFPTVVASAFRVPMPTAICTHIRHLDVIASQFAFFTVTCNRFPTYSNMRLDRCQTYLVLMRACCLPSPCSTIPNKQQFKFPHRFRIFFQCVKMAVFCDGFALLSPSYSALFLSFAQ